MAIDGIFLKNLILKLKDTITTGKITRIHQTSDEEILFNMRVHRVNHQLFFSIHPQFARLSITKKEYPSINLPTHFLTMMRKCLEGGYIEGIEQIELDRIAKLTIQSTDQIGDQKTYFLYHEIMGKHSNLILTDHQNIIIDALKHVPFTQNSVRILLPNATYQLPPLNNKINPLLSFDLNLRPYHQYYQGISTLLDNELDYRQQNFLNEAIHSEKLYLYERDQRQLFHCIPLTHLNKEPQIFELFEGLDHIYYQKDQRDRIKQQTNDLLKYLEREIKKLNLKSARLKNDLIKAQDYDHLRSKGELIFSALSKIKRGMTEIIVNDYESNQPVTIELDPRLDGKQNANLYFKRYKKSKAAIEHINRQLALTDDELIYFDSLLTMFKQASLKDAIQIKEELIQEGYLKRRIVKSTKKQKVISIETYQAPDGTIILVGKNHWQNDLLTFRFAKKADFWLHAHQLPGSHVILRSHAPSEQALRLAAMLAAYYSKGRHSSSIPVDYTLIQNIKKRPKGKPGQVLLSQYQTIYIDPDETLIEQSRIKPTTFKLP